MTALTRLILARHGATEANVRQPYVLQGLQPDSELVEAGREQARALGEALRRFRVSRIYTSPLKRARATAELIAEKQPAPIAIEESLAEADTGVWTGLTWAEIERTWPREHAAFHADPDQHGYLGGEALGAVRARVLPAVHAIVARHPGETCVVIGHGAVNRVLLASWMGLPPALARKLPQDNGGYNLIDFQEGKARVRAINSIAHLPAF